MAYNRSAFVTNTPMQDLCFDYMQERTDFIADSVFTPKPVPKADMKVYQADTSKLRLYETKNSTMGKANLIDEQLFSRNITLGEYKLAKYVNPRDVRDADVPFMLDEGRAAKVVTESLLLAREYAAAVLATTAANYTSSLTSTLSAGSRWDDSGDPEAQKQTADQAVQAISGIKRCNAVAFDIQVARKLRSNAAFIDRTKYTRGGPLNLDVFKEFFDVDFVFIAGNSYDSANEGGTRTLASPWGKDAIFFNYNPSANREDVSFGHMYIAEQAFWTKTVLDENLNGAAGSAMRVEVGTEYLLDKGYVESSSSNKFGAGYLYKSVIS